jgi:dipeptidase E
MGTIVAIGGGELRDGETLAIDEKIVGLADVTVPTVLFLPTASGDADGYVETFERVYGDEIGCQTEVLKLVERAPSPGEIERKIEAADVVYVGGGDTQEMLSRWEETVTARELRRAYRSGTVLSGISAGGICWFEAGYGDSVSAPDETIDWDQVPIPGLGLIEDVLFCPHYGRGTRATDFRNTVTRRDDAVGLGVDDNAAVRITDGELLVWRSDPDASVYHVRSEDGRTVETEVRTSEPTPLEELVSQGSVRE